MLDEAQNIQDNIKSKQFYQEKSKIKKNPKCSIWKL